jgi:hypothetical protein
MIGSCHTGGRGAGSTGASGAAELAVGQCAGMSPRRMSEDGWVAATAAVMAHNRRAAEGRAAGSKSLATALRSLVRSFNLGEEVSLCRGGAGAAAAFAA